MDLTKRCPHYGISSWVLVQTFYGVLNDNEKNMVDISSGGSFKRQTPKIHTIHRKVSLKLDLSIIFF